MADPWGIAEFLAEGETLSFDTTPINPLIAPLQVHKIATYMPITHELLVDSGGHVCDDTCPPAPPPPPPVPLRRRVRYALRRARWRVVRIGGLRLVHRDRIDLDRDE